MYNCALNGENNDACSIRTNYDFGTCTTLVAQRYPEFMFHVMLNLYEFEKKIWRCLCGTMFCYNSVRRIVLCSKKKREKKYFG